MLIFIQNSPRAYSWGSTHALPEVLEHEPTGEPQAELWLGDHASDPADIAGVVTSPLTLIDLIAENPEVYGVDGGHLPFLMKVLGIGAPLSLQVHPNLDQAEEGYLREEATGLPPEHPNRSYRDRNHKPELLVALTQVEALCGFRPIAEALADLEALATLTGHPFLQQLLTRVLMRYEESGNEAAAREAYFDAVFTGDEAVQEACRALSDATKQKAPETLDATRWGCLTRICETHPGDPGALVSLLLHHVTLSPGEALFLSVGELHAYLHGVGVEVMASSDNVLRAGLTDKHVDVAGLRRILNLETNPGPGFAPTSETAGMTTWQPPVSDFRLTRVRLSRKHELDTSAGDRAESVKLAATYPLVMITTQGLIRVERDGTELRELASVKKGYSLYISAGDPIELTGDGEAFIATVGEGFRTTF